MASKYQSGTGQISKRTLRRIYSAIGNPLSKYAAFVGGVFLIRAFVDPYLINVPIPEKLLFFIGVSAALALAIYQFLMPSNGARILKSIEKDFSPRTSDHVYHWFNNSDGGTSTLDIEQIAKTYGESK